MWLLKHASINSVSTRGLRSGNSLFCYLTFIMWTVLWHLIQLNRIIRSPHSWNYTDTWDKLRNPVEKLSILRFKITLLTFSPGYLTPSWSRNAMCSDPFGCNNGCIKNSKIAISLSVGLLPTWFQGKVHYSKQKFCKWIWRNILRNNMIRFISLYRTMLW